MTKIKKGFQIWNANIKCDYKNWLSFWESWPKREIFYHPGYANLYSNIKSQPLCAVYFSEYGNVIYPFILRELSNENFWNQQLPFLTDIITPYGSGGASFWNSDAPQILANNFWKQFDLWAVSKNVVSEYVRFAAFQNNLLDYPGQKDERVKHVAVDLTQTKDDLWKNFKRKVRKNINNAKRNNLYVEIDSTGEILNDFFKVYKNTMERREGNCFQKSYFKNLHIDLQGYFKYFHVIYKNKVISTELVLLSTENVYSFLGGTDADFFNVRPNDLLKYEIILWAKKNRFKKFVLGGGNNPEDGIFKYKLSFAPNGQKSRYVGSRIFKEDIYEKLINNRKLWYETQNIRWLPDSNYFPKYRA